MDKYAVGLILVLLFNKITKFNVSGVIALILMTVVSYGLGKFVLSLIYGAVCEQ